MFTNVVGISCVLFLKIYILVALFTDEVNIFLIVFFIVFYFILIPFFYNLFIYFWLCWVFAAVRGLPPVAESGGRSSLRRAGLSLRQPLPLWSTASRHASFSSCGSWAPGHRLSSCGPRAQLLRSMWDPPGPGLEPVSPALTGRRIPNHCATREAPSPLTVYLPRFLMRRLYLSFAQLSIDNIIVFLPI